jgi:O-antigen/teichoic acid export membrane protein
MMNIALLGTPQLAVRSLAVHSARSDWIAVRRLITRLGRAVTLVSALLAALSIAAALLLRPGDDRILIYTALGASLTGATSAVFLMAAELRGLGLMLKGQFMDIVGRPLAAVMIIGGALAIGITLNAILAVAIQLVIAVAAALVSGWWLRSAIPHSETRHDRRVTSAETSWLRAALPLGMVDILRQLDGTYGLILIGWIASATDLGIYRVAIAAAALPAMPVTVLHVILAPSVSRLYQFGEVEELQALLRRTSAIMTALLVPMLLTLVFFGREIVVLVFGPAYADSTVPLILLCASQLVFGFFGMGPILLAMCDKEKQLTGIYAVSVALGMLSAVPLIWMYGASGAAVAQLVSGSMIAFLSAQFARRQLGFGMTFIHWRRLSRDASRNGNGSIER